MSTPTAQPSTNCPENRQVTAGSPDTAFDTLRSGERRLVATRFLRQRALIVGVGLAVSVPIVWLSSTPVLQATALTAGVSVMATLFAIEAALSRRGRVVSEGAFFASLVVTLAGLSVACLITGGIHSPFMPILFAPSVTAFAAFGDARRRRIALAFVALIWVALAVLPLPFPPLPDAILPLLRVAGCFISVVLLYASVTALSDGLVRAGQRAQILTDRLVGQAVERSRDVETLSARLAHELNNPLSAIKGLLQLEAKSGVENRRLEVALAEVGRMQQLTESYLEQAITPSISRVSTPVEDLFAHLQDLLAHRLQKAGITLRCEPSIPVLNIDLSRVHEALLNLLLNAIHATPEGGQITLRAGASPDGSFLEVSDTGRGMTAEHLVRLEKTQPGALSVSGRPGGHGLGIAAVRAVVQAHDGHLSYRSTPHAGTVARIDLPEEAP